MSTAALARARQADRAKKARAQQAAIAWIGSGAALALALGLAVLLRQDIARVWPNTASAYAAVGLPVNVTGLEFNQITVAKTVDGPTPMLVVSGAVRNISHAQKKAPVLRFSLRDDAGAELAHWLEDLDGAPMKAGAVRPFRSTLDNPPPAAANLEATFATPSEVAKESARQPAVTPQNVPRQAALENGEGGPIEDGLTPLLPPAAFRSRPSDGLAPRLDPDSPPSSRD